MDAEAFRVTNTLTRGPLSEPLSGSGSLRWYLLFLGVEPFDDLGSKIHAFIDI